MKAKTFKAGGGASPRLQQNWDWRAASNFICGGAGGGLLFAAALLSLAGIDVRALLVAGMALIGIGLTCVWLEIGRPLRAMNVYRHIKTSWMTREALVAPVVFALGLLALLTNSVAATVLAGFAGAAFVYSQARILNADKGIPAWRHRACRPVVFATGLAEGAGLLAVAAPWIGLGIASRTGLVAGVLLLLLVRVLAWRAYVRALRASGAPTGSLRALAAIDQRVVVGGALAPALLLGVGILGFPASVVAIAAAGVLVVGAGWLLKYTLIRRAAFTQGLELKHQPVRGRGVSGPAAKPGWGGAG